MLFNFSSNFNRFVENIQSFHVEVSFHCDKYKDMTAVTFSLSCTIANAVREKCLRPPLTGSRVYNDCKNIAIAFM